MRFLGVFFSLMALHFPLVASEGLLHYAVKQGFRQGSLLLGARSVAKVLADPLTPASLIRPLKLSQEVLAYAHDKLKMKTSGAYRRFVELDRDWITQVVIAAEKDKLEIHKFHFPIVGSFPYKGFFDEDDAKALEAELAPKYDVYRRKVPAYSSLGWFNDPIMSNILENDAVLVTTLFHELTHFNFYFDDNGDFDEAFATWFSYKAAREFIPTSEFVENKEKTVAAIDDEERVGSQLNFFIDEITGAGQEFYKRSDSLAHRDGYFNWIKQCLAHYPDLKGLQKAKWNNAVILSFATYFKLLPSIEAYAQEHKLSQSELLKKVVTEGKSLATAIEDKKIAAAPKRCAEKIP